jgi:DNA-binding SARP family transcriptional activator
MNLNSVIEQSYNTFLQQVPQAKLILLHPRSRYRSILIAKLINNPGSHILYYALGPDDLNRKSFITGLTHELADQYPLFGRHVNMLSQGDADNLDALLNAFVRDLTEVSDEPFYLILDEYDRGDTADDIQMFVEKLVPRLPTQCRIVINSRTLPRLPWVSLIAQKVAILLEDHLLIKQNFYSTDTFGKTKLEVFALGPGQVLLDGQEVEDWEGHLPRLLFFFALDRPIITRSEICHAFWPELEMDQAVNVFHVTKRRLHKAMNMDVLVHDGGYYRVNPEMAIHYDVMDFASSLMEGRGSEGKARLAAWQRAIDLYRGPFLQGHIDRWILDRRIDFQAGYLEALTELAYQKLEEERTEHALTLFQRAIAADNQREDIHREVIKLYAHMGRRSEAAAHFQRLAEDLRKDEREPSQETIDLYNNIMS